MASEQLLKDAKWPKTLASERLLTDSKWPKTQASGWLLTDTKWSKILATECLLTYTKWPKTYTRPFIFPFRLLINSLLSESNFNFSFIAKYDSATIKYCPTFHAFSPVSPEPRIHPSPPPVASDVKLDMLHSTLSYFSVIFR